MVQNQSSNLFSSNLVIQVMRTLGQIAHDFRGNVK